jgi:hypothetical protein
MADLLLKLANEFREDAQRSRDLAACMSMEAERATLIQLAQQQETARELEAKAKVYE